MTNKIFQACIGVALIQACVVGILTILLNGFDYRMLANESPPPGCDRTGMSDCPKVAEVSKHD